MGLGRGSRRSAIHGVHLQEEERAGHRPVGRTPHPKSRIPKAVDGQPTLFDTHRFHAFFPTVTAEDLDTVTADKTHRRHAIIEQVNADLKDSALAHLPSGHFGANYAWLDTAVMAYNLTRAAGILAEGMFTKARTGTIRAKLINVPARIANSARRIRLHLPDSWPKQAAWENLHTATHAPPQAP